MAVAVFSDEHVRGERGKAGGDLPDVEVVNLGDSVNGGHPAADLVGVEVFWGGFEKDAAAGFEQAVSGVQHDRGNDQRGDAVGAAKAGDEDEGAGDRGEDERGEVGEDVLKGRPRRSSIDGWLWTACRSRRG